MQPLTKESILPLLDSTLLRQNATAEEIDTLCREALQWGFAAVCVHPCHLERIVRLLRGSPVRAATVVGFPMGCNLAQTKAAEAALCQALGAQELDMVMNIGAAVEGNFALVEKDILAVREAASKTTLKVILETCYLNNEQIEQACLAAVAAGADYVKTSTGFYTGGATLEHVRLMKAVVGNKALVKAAGGIRTMADCQSMVLAGASRIGTGTAGKIAQEGEAGIAPGTGDAPSACGGGY